MAHYAFLDENNVVTEVIVGRNENEIFDSIEDWEKYYGELRGQKCLRTSYNTHQGIHYNQETGLPSEDQSKSFRKNFASIGYTYDEENDAFVPPKPYNSWTLDEENFYWKPPVPVPNDGKAYGWHEDILSWVPTPLQPE